MKEVAIIGIQGVPANYGGFESLVENLLDHRSEGVRYTVFCSSKDTSQRLEEYKGCRLRYVPLHANGFQSVAYDIWSMMKCLRGFDAILILGVSGCVALPLVRLMSGARIIVNIDGLEHRRQKWGFMARLFLRMSEAMAVRWSDVVIADNQGILEYVEETYGRKCELIAYGGDHVCRDVPEEKQERILRDYGLQKGEYGISVCRIEPENNCELTLSAFTRAEMPLVFVGNWSRSEYSRGLKKRYGSFPNILLLDSIYDLDILHVLRANARCYIHGHSAGGTNPSLVEAMFFARPIAAFDVSYNRVTTFDKAYYYKNPDELMKWLNSDLKGEDRMSPVVLKEIAKQNYLWRDITSQYENLYIVSPASHLNPSKERIQTFNI